MAVIKVFCPQAVYNIYYTFDILQKAQISEVNDDIRHTLKCFCPRCHFVCFKVILNTKFVFAECISLFTFIEKHQGNILLIKKTLPMLLYFYTIHYVSFAGYYGTSSIFIALCVGMALWILVMILVFYTGLSWCISGKHEHLGPIL